jgi:uncharacterized membrane protein
MKKAILILIFSVLHFALLAQDTQPEMADVMRSNGKIYVVVAVLGVILLGIITYLFILDKKLSKLEKQIPK